MPTSMVDEAGNVWEVDDAGNPVRLVAPAAKGRVFSLSPNPKDVRSEARADEDQQMQRDNAVRAERAADRADKTAQRQAAAAEKAASAAAKPSEFQSKSAGFLGRMMQAELDFGAVPVADRGARSLPRQTVHNVAPGLENTFLNSEDRQKADQAVENFIAASLRQESGASISPVEFERQYKIFFPAPGDTPEVITQKANARRQAIESFRIAAGPLADAAAGTARQQADNEVPDPNTGADLKPPPADNSPDDRPPENNANSGAASGKSRVTYDPRMSSQIDAMINAGASKGMIDAVLKRQNFPVVTPGEWSAIQGWRQKNPGKKYYGANISRDDDLSFRQRLSGSALGSGLAHAADAGTAGLVSLASGEEGRGALDAMSVLHPEASAIGDVAGGVAGALGAEASVAARAPSALVKYAPRVADALYGSALGFNTAEEGEGLKGAALGAGAGLVGGAIGQKAMSGAGRIARGVRDADVGYLRGQGIPLTVGQILGTGGAFGRGVKKIEDSLTSVPFVGNAVDARRVEGLRGFNRAAFGEAGAPIGVSPTDIGAGGIRQLRQGVGNAYDSALNPAQIDASDPAFLADLAAARNSAQNIPNVNSAQDAALAALDSRVSGAIDPSGMIPGRNFQEAYRGLARTGRERAAGDYGHEIGQSMREGQDALASALERQNPGAFDAFKAANSANRNANVLAETVNRAKNAEDEIFTPAQLNMADTQSARRLTGPLASASGERPFFDLTSAGQAVLPSKLPDSGTWTRMLVGGGATGLLGGGGAVLGGSEGAGVGTGGGLLLTLALAAGGSKPAQKAMTKILADRPDLAIRIGNQLVDYAGVGGWTGSGTLAPLLIEP